MNVLFGNIASTRYYEIIDLNGKILKQWNNYHDDNMAIQRSCVPGCIC